MIPEIGTGIQDFEKIRLSKSFYVDKSDFIREWWMGNDDVTLITRPRRFGKTLNLSMLNCFFSNKYENRSDLFEGLKVWDDPAMRAEQGKWPVIFLSFADVKPTTFEEAKAGMNMLITKLYNDYYQMLQGDLFTDMDRELFSAVGLNMGSQAAARSLQNLCEWLERYYGKKVLIFLDEYDTPLQEAYAHGFWDEMVAYIRSLFNSTFKTNMSLARAVMTGITRVSRESIFSDLNNLDVVTTTSDKYSTCFGFTEQEVFAAMDARGFSEDDKKAVKKWYDGFTFGQVTDIYNPWSVTNYFDKRKLDTYWANSSSNSLVGTLLRQGTPIIKSRLETLLNGGMITVPVDEQIVFNQLDRRPDAIWSLLLATGYLKITQNPFTAEIADQVEEAPYTLAVTNLEVRRMFHKMIREWFAETEVLPAFTRAMLAGDTESMEEYLDRIMLESMSSFDSGRGPSDRMPENFYHGLVLGLLAGSQNDYLVRSNRESGLGRYDVVMEPRREGNPAVIMEFKVFSAKRGETTLEDTAANALKQIEEKKYDTDLLARGIPADRIRKYAFAFRGREVLIRKGGRG